MTTAMPLCLCVSLNFDCEPPHSYVPLTSIGTKENTSCELLDKRLEMGGGWFEYSQTSSSSNIKI